MVEYRKNKNWTSFYISVDYVSDFSQEVQKFGQALEIVDVQWFITPWYKRLIGAKRWTAICMVHVK